MKHELYVIQSQCFVQMMEWTLHGLLTQKT